MVKKHRKKIRRIPAKMTIPIEETSSTPKISSDNTSSPLVSYVPTNAKWDPSEVTRAPDVGEVIDSETEYASSYPELIEKYLLSRQSIFFLLSLIVIGFFFIQDNQAGKLNDWNGLLWTFQKSGILIGTFLLVGLVQHIIKKYIIK